MDDNMKSVFREGAQEFLAEMEEALLFLSEDPNDIKQIDKLFRAMHSMKGSAAMVEFNDVSKFAHTLESECDIIRQGAAQVTQSVIEVALRAHDHFREMIDSYFGMDPVESSTTDNILTDFKSAIKETASGQSIDVPKEQAIIVIQQISELLDVLREDFGNNKVIGQISFAVSTLFLISQNLHNDSLTEFLVEFESFFRKARLFKIRLPEATIPVSTEIIEEAFGMLEEKPFDMDASMDPDELLAELQRPLEIKGRLEDLLQKITFPEAPLPPSRKYKIKLSVTEVDKRKLVEGSILQNLLPRLGEVEILPGTSDDLLPQENN